METGIGIPGITAFDGSLGPSGIHGVEDQIQQGADDGVSGCDLVSSIGVLAFDVPMDLVVLGVRAGKAVQLVVDFLDAQDLFLGSLAMSADRQQSSDRFLGELDLLQSELDFLGWGVWISAKEGLEQQDGTCQGVSELVRHAVGEHVDQARAFGSCYFLFGLFELLTHGVDGPGQRSDGVLYSRFDRDRFVVSACDPIDLGFEFF